MVKRSEEYLLYIEMMIMRPEPLLKRRPAQLKPKEAPKVLPKIKPVVNRMQQQAAKIAQISLRALPPKARNTEIARMLRLASNPLNIKSAKVGRG
jgi:hypothetical protein